MRLAIVTYALLLCIRLHKRLSCDMRELFKLSLGLVSSHFPSAIGAWYGRRQVSELPTVFFYLTLFGLLFLELVCQITGSLRSVRVSPVLEPRDYLNIPPAL